MDAATFDATLWAFDHWSFAVPTEPSTVVLDTRTRRSFDSPRARRLVSAEERARVVDVARQAGHHPGSR